MSSNERLVKDQPAEIPLESGPLTSYEGKTPPAPEWFREAVAHSYETRYVDVKGAKVHYQRWGQRGSPGLLFVHGNGAHAHWWDFIAPYFSEKYNVAALTFSGMGDSERRENYDMATFALEELEVARDAGMFEANAKPIIVSHSFGGFVTLLTAADYGEQFEGTVIVDSPVNPPDRQRQGPPRSLRGNRVYPDLRSALARFRLAPPQLCENHFAMDYIARWSLKRVHDGDSQEGWTWKFDPRIWQRFEAGREPSEMLKSSKCRIALFRGEESGLMPDDVGDYMQGLLGHQVPFISIPHARHHVMIDQPLAFVSALRTLLGEWAHSTPERQTT